MVLGGIRALYPGRNTSKRNKLHAVYKYLLRDVEMSHPNQAWMVDIAYLRMPKRFMYLVAIYRCLQSLSCWLVVVEYVGNRFLY